MGRKQNLTRMSVGQGLDSDWSMILRVTSVCKSTNAGEMRSLRWKRSEEARAPGDPALAEQQDVETPEEVLGESASVKRGADAVADDEERARL